VGRVVRGKKTKTEIGDKSSEEIGDAIAKPIDGMER